MVDIAAQLSLTPTGPALDPSIVQGAVLGLESADSQAFGDILASQVAGSLGLAADTGAPAAPLPPLPIPAGNRQPGGKILPGAAQILPDAATFGLEAPAAQVLPGVAAIPVPANPVPANSAALRLVTPAFAARLAAPVLPAELAPTDLATPETETPEPKPGEGSPVHGLIKMLTAALKGQRSAERAAERADERADDEAPADPAMADANGETDASGQAALLAGPVLALAPVPAPTAPVLPLSAAAAAFEAPRAAAGDQAPRAAAGAPAAPREQAQAALAQVQPILAQFMAQQLPAANAAPADAPVLPVLTVAATTTPPAADAASDTAALPVTLVAAPALPLGQTVAARIKLASPATKAVPAEPGAPGEGALPAIPASRAVPASPAAPAVRAVLAERAAPDAGATSPATALADSLPQSLAASPVATAPAASAPVAAAPVATAPVVELPRHDFAALVDRLIEARNASTPQSTHASLNHAEFGQVSLHFQQDGGDLTVGMSSADPEFARAVQAAMPADRQAFAADTGARGQSGQAPGQSSAQPQAQGGNSSHSQHDAAGRGTDGAGQQGRGGQDRNSRGNNNSNPSPRWADRNQPQTRGGIFA